MKRRMVFVTRVLVAVMLLAAWAHLTAGHASAALAAGPLLLGGVRPLAKAYEWLRDVVKPANSGQPESIPHVLFDTQTYAQAGQATLQFFQSTAANRADPTLSNFASGNLEAYNYFEIHRAFMIIHALPNTNAAVAITGAASDVEIIHKTARGILTFAMAGKNYFGFPLAFFGRPGGPVPIYSSYGTGTVANNVITAGETENNGGFPVLGNIVIPPMQQVKTTLQFNSTAISAATNITVAYMGVLHRPVR
jgi:hypothetical protein